MVTHNQQLASEAGRIVTMLDGHLVSGMEAAAPAGDVIGRQHSSQMATPVGSRQGGIAARNALSVGPVKAVNHRVIPRVIFTDPEVGVVRMTEAEGYRGRSPSICW